MEKEDYNFIQKLAREAEFYENPDHIDQLVQSGKIQHVSLQPLSVAFRQWPLERIVQWLPALSREQRLALLDIDLWNKDHLSVQDFSYWLKVYEKISSEKIQVEFVGSEQFALFFKGVMNISTFDDEDPVYPDHKNFFLTDDHLLLIEHDELFPYVDELKNLLRIFYSHHGVEKAYAHLFKIVADSFLIFQEEQYRLKKGRLQDYGLVDYYEALEFLAPLKTMDQLNHFISTRKKPKGRVDAIIKNQILPKKMVLPYEKMFNSIQEELARVEDRERIDFLQFNFIKTVNGALALDDSLKKGAIFLAQAGSETRYYILLGLEYIRSQREFISESVFDIFDFCDLYKVGKSMIKTQTSRLKRALLHYGFSEPEEKKFLGSYFENFLTNSLAKKPSPVCDLKTFYSWMDDIRCLEGFLPTIAQFQKTYLNLLEKKKIEDKNFINYKAEEVDFEALILSSLLNFALGFYGDFNDSSKIGLSVKEVKEFAQKHFADYLHSTQSFCAAFGLEKIPKAPLYLSFLLRENLEGYDFSSMENSDFAHVGGPLIFEEN